MEPYVKIRWSWGEKVGEYNNKEDKVKFIWKDEDGNWSLFWWEEGNGGCDCNRASMFCGIEDQGCGQQIEIEEIEIIEDPEDLDPTDKDGKL